MDTMSYYYYTVTPTKPKSADYATHVNGITYYIVYHHTLQPSKDDYIVATLQGGHVYSFTYYGHNNNICCSRHNNKLLCKHNNNICCSMHNNNMHTINEYLDRNYQEPYICHSTI